MSSNFLRKVKIELMFVKKLSTVCDSVKIIKSEKIPSYEDASNKRKMNCCNNSLKIVFLGLPGVGKSSIINKIIGRPMCCQSSEILTVQNNFFSISRNEDTKLTFLDIPGSMYKTELDNKLKLKSSFNEIDDAVRNSDIVAVVLDVMNVQWEKVLNLRTNIFGNHFEYKLNPILILNKIDMLSNKSNILNLISKVKLNKNMFQVNDIFIVSASNGDGVEDLKNYFLDVAESKNSFHDSGQVFNPKPKLIIQQTVNSIFFKNFKNELPFLLNIYIDYLKFNDDDSIDIIVNVECPSIRIGRLIVGRKGNRIKSIARETEQLLSSIFQMTVRSKIAVLLKEESK
uniref:GTPase Era, mitochondrial n=1 Tax=Trichogramma kaykai TaxID=54128 RepID=A0ABD2W9W7_9HYME